MGSVLGAFFGFCASSSDATPRDAGSPAHAIVLKVTVGEPTSVRRPGQPTFLGLAVVFGVVLTLVGFAAYLYITHRSAPEKRISEQTPAVYFNPGDHITAALVSELNAAKRSVHVQAYSFSSVPIAKALIEAKRRGVEVTAILDRSDRTLKNSSADSLAHEGKEGVGVNLGKKNISPKHVARARLSVLRRC